MHFSACRLASTERLHRRRRPPSHTLSWFFTNKEDNSIVFYLCVVYCWFGETEGTNMESIEFMRKQHHGR